MNLAQIQNGSTIIAPAYLHYEIRKTLLKQHPGIKEIHLCTLEVWQNLPNDEHVIYEFYEAIKRLLPKLTYNKDTASSYSFLKETMQFIIHLKQFNLLPENIKSTNPFMNELKEIVSHLYSIPLAIDHKPHIDSKLTNTYIIDEYCDLYHHEIYTSLEAKGAKRIHFHKEVTHKEYYYALNKRQEIESAAQYIIEHNLKVEDIKISLLDNSYKEYVKTVFKRYQIPFYFTNDSHTSFIHEKYLSLLRYLLHKDHTHAVELLQSQIISHPAIAECINYMNVYELDFHDNFNIVSSFSTTSDIIDQSEILALSILEKQANEVKDILLPKLQKLEAMSFQDILIGIDAFLLENHNFQSQEERNALLMIRKEIIHAYKYIHTSDDIAFFMSVLTQQKISQSKQYQGIAISDFTHPLPERQYHLVLGCLQENYPAFTSESGIYEETMHKNAGYPALEKRYQHHTTQYTTYLNTSEYLTCFYNISTFDGKTQESSLEIDAFMGKAKRYPLLQHNTFPKRSYHISEEEAKQLFYQDNTLHGSISSLEKYAACPYAYFLRYGLKLKEPKEYGLSPAKSGTLSHYLMEILVSAHGKEYIHAKTSEITTVLEEKILELSTLYPNEKAFLSLMKERLLTSIMENLAILKDHEENSSLNEYICEKPFSYEFTFANNLKLKLHGIIDRIDMNHDFFRIIDYKSSEKTLQENQVFSALQLQLITYLVISEKQLNRRPLGAFYYSLNHPNITMIHTKLKKRPLGYETTSMMDGITMQIKEKRLSGWITSEHIEVMDQNGSHIKGVRNSKASGINTSTIYKSSTLYSYIESIYEILTKQILSGDIQCESAEGACTYCPYAMVCGNAHHPKRKEELIEINEELYVKGGRKHD